MIPGGHLSPQLRQTQLIVINDTRCYDTVDLDKVYCLFAAFSVTSISNVCVGDSGGPIMYNNNGRWFVYGIVSFEQITPSGECDYTLPSYAVQVPKLLTWLNSNGILPIKSNSSRLGTSFFMRQILIFLIFLSYHHLKYC